MAKPSSINLLKKNEKTFFDSFISWALTIGRIIVVLTEGIALFAFIYRFSLDRQIVDLHDQVNQDQTFVKLLKNDENTFRNLQDRLATIKKIDVSSKKMVTLLFDIQQYAPQNLSITNSILANNLLQMTITASSPTLLSDFIQKLRSDPRIASISVDSIQNKTSLSQIVMLLSASVKTDASL